MHVGIDIEQFIRDPYASGIQRVLQYLALEWPDEDVHADFVVPYRGGHGILRPDQAGELLTLPFTPREPGSALRESVNRWLEATDPLRVKDGDLLALYDAWLLPEVSYLPTVLRRFELFGKAMPTVMIGYDALPMTEPANYRFKPGTNAWVSEYFRQLATSDSVVCISDWSRDSILARLRRDPSKAISVAHPGGDHIAVRDATQPERTTFVRLGTMEARKQPVQIAQAFRRAVDEHEIDAELLFIGGASASDDGINAAIREQIAAGGVRWVEGASDSEIYDLVHHGSVFLSIGVEGYGIPVLEAARLGTPTLFAGVQPAASLMAGNGSRRIVFDSEEEQTRLFAEWAGPSRLDSLYTELDATAVPRWSDFASDVAMAIRATL